MHLLRISPLSDANHHEPMLVPPAAPSFVPPSSWGLSSQELCWEVGPGSNYTSDAAHICICARVRVHRAADSALSSCEHGGRWTEVTSSWHQLIEILEPFTQTGLRRVTSSTLSLHKSKID